MATAPLKDRLKTLLQTGGIGDASRGSNGAVQVGTNSEPKVEDTTAKVAPLLAVGVGAVLLGWAVLQASRKRNEGQNQALRDLLLMRQSENEYEED